MHKSSNALLGTVDSDSSFTNTNSQFSYKPKKKKTVNLEVNLPRVLSEKRVTYETKQTEPADEPLPAHSRKYSFDNHISLNGTPLRSALKKTAFEYGNHEDK